MTRQRVNPSVPDSYRHAKDVILNAVRDRLDAEGLTSEDFKKQSDDHEAFASRLDEESEEAQALKTALLDKARKVIKDKGLDEPQKVAPKYPAIRREMYTRLTRSEDHHFSLIRAWAIATALGAKVEFTVK